MKASPTPSRRRRRRARRWSLRIRDGLQRLWLVALLVAIAVGAAAISQQQMDAGSAAWQRSFATGNGGVLAELRHAPLLSAAPPDAPRADDFLARLHRHLPRF